ncbi:hypothetical protein C0J52_06742 [Blattella germanica]|nr:hypothetical protein C0J52_06742 [Blattella germanica]
MPSLKYMQYMNEFIDFQILTHFLAFLNKNYNLFIIFIQCLLLYVYVQIIPIFWNISLFFWDMKKEEEKKKNQNKISQSFLKKVF